MVNEQNFSRLEQLVFSILQEQDGCSGIHLLDEGLSAFAARYMKITTAEKTLDVQYYIWRNDISGGLLFEALWSAANRGVQIRLLLDDNNTVGMDNRLLELNAHPAITVRLFNPFRFRRFRIVNYLTDFSRLNRRMHNKSLTADRAVTIVGGRNVGDEYFGTGTEPLFYDVDVMAVGRVVAEVTEAFEQYWQSASVFPLETILQDKSFSSGSSEAGGREENSAALVYSYVKKIDSCEIISQLEKRTFKFIRAKTRLLCDDPRKGLGQGCRTALLSERLKEAIGTPVKQLDLFSAYFVPTRTGVSQLISLARQGVKIDILTNSLAANDVSIVHAGYAKWRKKLLRHGIRLHELKPWSEMPAPTHDRGLTGHSGSSLHAKT
ncbi:MAG: Cardiolipin synthase C [Candidatus Erwinia impunctatus]|nr:Cardiolipin synthase C [Culicoides impunctatus]